MEKKLGDYTLKEIENICKKCRDSECCPFNECESYVCGISDIGNLDMIIKE